MVNSTVRLDIPYIRRRVKKGSESVASVAPAPERRGLSLGNSKSTPEAERSSNLIPQASAPLKVKQVAPEKKVSVVPGVDGKIILSEEFPVVRLNPLQSAIGSLVISNAEAFAWEGLDGYGAIVLPDQVSTAPVLGGRKLVEFYKGDVVLGLRHFKSFRRLILGTRSGTLKVSLYDGSEIAASGGNGNNALIMYRIDNEIEIRLEVINSTDLLGVFGIQAFPA